MFVPITNNEILSLFIVQQRRSLGQGYGGFGAIALPSPALLLLCYALIYFIATKPKFKLFSYCFLCGQVNLFASIFEIFKRQERSSKEKVVRVRQTEIVCRNCPIYEALQEIENYKQPTVAVINCRRNLLGIFKSYQ